MFEHLSHVYAHSHGKGGMDAKYCTIEISAQEHRTKSAEQANRDTSN